jgi:predicted MFS family arabinose efflux permease
VVGTIMSGLLVGILLSRTLSGFIGDTGWRAVLDCFRIMSRIIFIIKKQFPYNKPVFNGSYKNMIGSLFTLIKQPLLRETNVIQFCSIWCFLQWFYYFQKNLSILLVPQ